MRQRKWKTLELKADYECEPDKSPEIEFQIIEQAEKDGKSGMN
jgi:hypothetical protein